MLGRVSPRRHGLHRRGAPRARQVDLGYHLACRRHDGDVRVDVGDVDRDAQVHVRPLRPAGGRNRAVDRVQQGRLHRVGNRTRPVGGVPAGQRVQSLLRRRRARDLGERSGGAVPAGSHRRRARRLLRQRGRPGQPGGRHDGAGERCPPQGSDDHRGRRRDRGAAPRRRDHRGANRSGRHRSRVGRQLRRHVGPPTRRGRRCQHPAAGSGALLPHHRADRGAVEGLAADRGPGQLRLLPRGSRRADDRTVRVGVRAVERGPDPRRLLVRDHPTRLGPDGALPRARHESRADLVRHRDSHLLLRPGELHPRSAAGGRGVARVAQLLRRPG